MPGEFELERLACLIGIRNLSVAQMHARLAPVLSTFAVLALLQGHVPSSGMGALLDDLTFSLTARTLSR